MLIKIGCLGLIYTSTELINPPAPGKINVDVGTTKPRFLFKTVDLWSHLKLKKKKKLKLPFSLRAASHFYQATAVKLPSHWLRLTFVLLPPVVANNQEIATCQDTFDS